MTNIYRVSARIILTQNIPGLQEYSGTSTTKFQIEGREALKGFISVTNRDGDCHEMASIKKSNNMEIKGIWGEMS